MLERHFLRFVPLALVVFSQNSLSLLDQDGKGSKDGVVALYLFNEKSGKTVRDRSGFGTPLNLEISNTSNIEWTGKSLIINKNTSPRGFNRIRPNSWNNFDIKKDSVFITSTQPANKIHDQCNKNKQITLQTYFRSSNRVQQANIFSLEFPAGFYQNFSKPQNQYGRLAGSILRWSPNFIPYRVEQQYPGGIPKIRFRYRGEKGARIRGLGIDLESDLLKIDRDLSDNSKIHEVIFTHNSNGQVEVYLDRFLVHSYLPTQQDTSTYNFSPEFFRKNYSTAYIGGKNRQLHVAIGNKAFPGEITDAEIDYVIKKYNEFSKLSVDRDSDGKNDNDFPKYKLDTKNRASVKKYIERQLTHGFEGEIFMAAAYCKYFTPAQVLDGAEPYQTQVASQQVTTANPSDPFLKSAKVMLERITGIKHSLFSKDVNDIADLLAQGSQEQAVELAINHREFLNTTVKNMAQSMSNRSETIDESLNDFVASFIGVVRDDIDARELLTGDFMYIADPEKVSVPSDAGRDILTSNRHYETLENQMYDIGASLVRVDSRNPVDDPVGETLLGQSLLTGENNKVVPLRDSAGVVTSRAFMEEHASAGTNRRLVEYTFRQFMCVPIEQWADSSASDARVGGDITRFPSGDHRKYQTSCKSCHTVMDGFRGAFAYYDFSDGRVKNSSVNPIDALGIDPWTINADSSGVATKINWNQSIYPTGFATTDNSFVNQANRGSNERLFGWASAGGSRGPASVSQKASEVGYGAKGLGQLIANSQRFPECMATRSYEALCLHSPSSVAKHASVFMQSNYNFKELFKSIAMDPNCWKDQ
ncbi:MAG: hypothetical protein HRT45_01185 [Bdellovibrionales bacterium]|nr:hypothetical protein [Bdellovibrionales bacterium]